MSFAVENDPLRSIFQIILVLVFLITLPSCQALGLAKIVLYYVLLEEGLYQWNLAFPHFIVFFTIFQSCQNLTF